MHGKVVFNKLLTVYFRRRFANDVFFDYLCLRKLNRAVNRYDEKSETIDNGGVAAV